MYHVYYEELGDDEATTMYIRFCALNPETCNLYKAIRDATFENKTQSDVNLAVDEMIAWWNNSLASPLATRCQTACVRDACRIYVQQPCSSGPAWPCLALPGSVRPPRPGRRSPDGPGWPGPARPARRSPAPNRMHAKNKTYCMVINLLIML